MSCLLCYHNDCYIKIAGLTLEKSGLLLLTHTGNPVSIHKTMITIFVKDCNQISQSFYDSVIFDLQLHQMTCSCSHSACLSVHGYYWRSVKLPSGTLRLRVCPGWNVPNAVLPMRFFYPLWFPIPRYCFPTSKGSAMTTKKDAASAWSVRPIHPLMKTMSNPYSETTGSAGEKNCVLSGLASLHWVLWSFPVFRIIRHNSCRYICGSIKFFSIPHNLTRQCLYCPLQ